MQQGFLDQADVPGWRIEDWDHLKGNDLTIRDLKHARFQTVEQIAGASDSQIQSMGMGGPGLREQARKDLKRRNESQYTDEMEAMRKEIADLKAMLKK